MLKVKCPNCGKKFKVAEKYAGQEAACTGCGKAIIIPTPQPEKMPDPQPPADLGDLELDLASLEGAPETTQDEIGTEADMEVDLPPDDEASDDAMPAPAPAARESTEPVGKTFVSIPAIVAIGCGAIALIPADAAGFTYIKMPLAAIGMIVGLVSLVTSLTDKRVVPVLPLAAVVIAGIGVVMAITGNIKLGMDRVTTEEPPAEVAEPEGEPVVEAPPEPEPDPEPAAPPPPAVGVSIESVRIASIEFRNDLGAMEKTDKAHLAITIRIQNNGETPVQYTTWAGIPGSYSLDIAALEDETGRAFRRVSLGQSAAPVGRVNETTIEPGDAVTDLLLFERPIGRLKPMELDLPGANVGVNRPYTLTITPDIVQE